MGLLTAITIIIILLLKPLPQDMSYHYFADQRTILGIPHFMDVFSNLLFVLVGVYGLLLLGKTTVQWQVKLMYAILFSGIILTGIGSAYYHYAPDNNTLVYDRIPMTIVFMAFLAATVAELINRKVGMLLLFPLLVAGVASVLWWHYTEEAGAGDLRFYGFIQFYPMVMIPVIIWLFRLPAYSRVWRILLWIVTWYVIAKVAEHFDKEIYSVTGFISGHSIKHIAAAVATWFIVKMFSYKYIEKPV